MGYSPTYRDVYTGERSDDEKSRCSCIGFLGICVAMVIFGIIITIPSMLNGSIIFVGGPLTFLLMFFGPFVVCAVVIKLGSGYREKTETDNLQ
ncbi:MAG: hypothetical protein ACFFDV_12145 [Candidatus Thorarchaeota archaeon]